MKKRHAALIMAASTVVPYLMVAFERWSLDPLVWGGGGAPDWLVWS